MATIKSPILDITVIDLHNPKLLGVIDLSKYPTVFNILNPTIEVTPPGFPRVTLTFSTNSLNVFDSNMLNITCSDDSCGTVDLPDGIWTVKYSISPSNTYFSEKSFIKVDQIEIKWGKAFLQTDLKVCDRDVKDEDMQQLDQIFSYIQGAIADANECNPISAMNKYQQADKMLNNFLRCKF